MQSDTFSTICIPIFSNGISIFQAQFFIPTDRQTISKKDLRTGELSSGRQMTANSEVGAGDLRDRYITPLRCRFRSKAGTRAMPILPATRFTMVAMERASYDFWRESGQSAELYELIGKTGGADQKKGLLGKFAHRHGHGRSRCRHQRQSAGVRRSEPFVCY